MEQCETYNNLDSSFFPSDPHYFTIIYTNIRSVRRNFNNFLAELSKVKNKVSCIVMSEVWISSDEVSLYSIPGYKTYANCNDTYRSGGVMCYLSEEFTVNKIDVNFTTADCLLLEVKRSSNFHLNIFCSYRLHHFTEMSFIDELNENLVKIN